MRNNVIRSQSVWSHQKHRRIPEFHPQCLISPVCEQTLFATLVHIECDLPKCRYSSFLSRVMVLPLMSVMVRRSACRGSKSVDARTISSPTRQPEASSTSIDVLPAFAVLLSLV